MRIETRRIVFFGAGVLVAALVAAVVVPWIPSPSGGAQRPAASPGIRPAAPAETAPLLAEARAVRAGAPTGAAAKRENPTPGSPPPPAIDGSGRMDEGDELLESIESVRPDFPDTPLGRRLSAHMARVEGVGPDAEALYRESLEALREEPEEAAALLLEAYQRMDAERYLDRWKVVDTLASLDSHRTVDALADIAAEPVPERERPVEDHAFDPGEEEQLIRVAAVRGLEELAQRGVKEAETELAQLVYAEDDFVRERAVLAYRRLGATGPAQRLSELREALPEEDHWMLRLQEVGSVEQMPQPSPRDESPAPGGAEDAGGAEGLTGTPPTEAPIKEAPGAGGSPPPAMN